MDVKTFELLNEFQSLENDLYFKLEKDLGMDKAEELVSNFTDLRERTLKIGKYLDDSKVVNKEGYLSKQYQDFPSYLKVTAIYEYDNGFSLCETTSGLIKLIPSDLIKTDKQ